MAPAAGRESRVPMARVGALAVLAVLMALVVVPVLVVAAGSFWSAPFIRLPGALTLANYAHTLTADSGTVLFSTLQFTVGAALVATAVGGGLAWAVVRTDVPFKPIVRWLPIAPMLVSGLVTNIGWIVLYSPKSGLVNIWLRQLFGFDQPVFNIYSMAGLVAALGLYLVPIPYLIFLGPLGSMDRSLDEASRASGAGQLRTLRHVTVPLLVPAIMASFTLVAIIAAHAFETPILIGLPGGVRTYVATIYQSMTGSQNYGLASAQAMIYLALIGALLVWNRYITKVESRFALLGGKGSPPGVNRLGPWRWVLLALIVFEFIVGFAQLVAANVLVSLLPYYTTTGDLPGLTLANYVAAAESPRSLEAIVNSMVVAGIVSVSAVLLATFLAFIAYKTRWAGRRLGEELGTLPIAFPPLILSMALLLTLLSIPGLVALYNSFALLVLVLTVVFLPFALRVVSTATIAIDDQLLEASASSGARVLRTTRSIVIPLMTTGLAGALAIAFVMSFRELGGVALIQPPTMPLLPVYIYTLFISGSPSQQVYALNIISSLIALVIPLVVVLLVWIGLRVARRRAAWGQGGALGMLGHTAAPDA